MTSEQMKTKLAEHEAQRPERVRRWLEQAVLFAWNEGELSEGQASGALDVDRLTARDMLLRWKEEKTLEPDGIAEAAYRERNLLAQLCAALAQRISWPCWLDASDAERPILFIGTDAGQISYRVPLNDLTNFMAELPRKGPEAWDGHDLAEKQLRVCRAIDYVRPHVPPPWEES